MFRIQRGMKLFLHRNTRAGLCCHCYTTHGIPLCTKRLGNSLQVTQLTNGTPFQLTIPSLLLFGALRKLRKFLGYLNSGPISKNSYFISFKILSVYNMTLRNKINKLLKLGLCYFNSKHLQNAVVKS